MRSKCQEVTASGLDMIMATAYFLAIRWDYFYSRSQETLHQTLNWELERHTTFNWTVPLSLPKPTWHFDCFHSAFAEVVPGKGWKHEAQLHTGQRPARDASGQTQRRQPERGETHVTTSGPVNRWCDCGWSSMLWQKLMSSSPHFCLVTLQSCYKESWTKLRDGGYKLRLDAIPFQSAKTSAEILSDVRHCSGLAVAHNVGMQYIFYSRLLYWETWQLHYSWSKMDLNRNKTFQWGHKKSYWR